VGIQVRELSRQGVMNCSQSPGGFPEWRGGCWLWCSGSLVISEGEQAGRFRVNTADARH